MHIFICLSASDGIISHSSNPEGTQHETRYAGLCQISHTDARRHDYTWHAHTRATEPRSRLCQWSLPSGMRRTQWGCGSSQTISSPLRLWVPPSGKLRPRALPSRVSRHRLGPRSSAGHISRTTQRQRRARLSPTITRSRRARSAVPSSSRTVFHPSAARYPARAHLRHRLRKTLTILTGCAPIRRSSWPVAAYPIPAGTFARSRPSRAGRMLRTCAISSA